MDKLKVWSLDSVLGLLNALNVPNVKREGDTIRCSCPRGMFGKQYHNHKNLRNPACVVTIGKGGWIRYHCFSCMEDDEYGDLEVLPNELIRWSKINPEELSAHSVYERAIKAIKVINNYHIEGVGYLPQLNLVPTIEIKQSVFKSYPIDWFENNFKSVFESESALYYLRSRGLSDSTIQSLDIRFTYGYQSSIYVCFPYYNRDGIFAGVRGRCILDDQFYTDEAIKNGLRKHKPFKPSKDSTCNEGHTWYRENKLDLSKPVVITEGQFDVAAILPIYENVTCLFRYSASPKKYSLLNNSAGIILLLDNDPIDSDAYKNVTKSRIRMENYYKGSNTKFINYYYPDGINDAGECPFEILKSTILDSINKLLLK